VAAVHLAGVYLARIADLGTVLRLNRGVALEEGGGRRARQSVGANGRLRLIRRPGVNRPLTVKASRVDRRTRELLYVWEAQEALLRDGRGRVVFGFYVEPDIVELPGLPVCDVTLRFQPLSVEVFA
jgi:hypothetical protein